VKVLAHCLLEPGLAGAPPGERFQFVRHGYFIADEADSRPGRLVFNRIIELRDTYKADKGAASPGSPSGARKPAGRTVDAKPGPSVAAGTISDERVRARAGNAGLARRYEEYVGSLGLSPELADVLTGDAAVADFFDAAFAAYGNARSIANWIANDLLGELKGGAIDALPFGGGELAELVKLVDERAVTGNAARTVLAEMIAGGGKPREIAARLGLDQAVSESELGNAIDTVLAGLPDKVEQYRAGKTSLLGLFMGLVMRSTGGKASPQAVQDLLKRKLG
jgi:glutaminyl-tRNA synthetase